MKRYVALGSSMAAGPGIAPRVDGSPRAAQRSARNYPHLVLEELASLDEDAREEAIEDAVEALEERFEDLDADWLETFQNGDV